MLQVNRVFHRYKNQRNYTLKNISFHVEAGEIISILGETGCGKTTLLQSIAGLQQIEKGNIQIDNELVKGPNEVLIPGNKNIALLAQDFKLMPAHTVFENLEYFIRRAEQKFIKLRCNNLLRHFDLLRHRNKKPKQLSGGQQQKLALAIALSTQPKVLLMDEPFSHLDIVQSTTLKEEILKIAKELSLAVLIVTHNIKDALHMSDKIIVMDNGKILQKDEPKTIYTNPTNAKVAQLTGYVNIVDIPFLKLVLDNKTFKALQSNAAKLFCIRPENIELKNGNNALVETVDFQGDNQIVKLRVKNELITASIHSNENMKIGEPCSIKISPKNIHPLN